MVFVWTRMAYDNTQNSDISSVSNFDYLVGLRH